MNNGNSSKQVLLSVVGIAILVIAVVGVSFAFFTYSKTGDNQLLTTGTIFFQFTEGNQINLIDQFPTPDATGSAWTNGGLANSVLDFTVVGHDSSGKGIDYTITAVKGDEPLEGGRTLLKDDEVKLYITQVSSENAGTAKPFVANFGNGGGSSYKHVSEGLEGYDGDSAPNGAIEAGVLLGTGHITGTSNTLQQTDKYEVRMWISSDCKIGDAGTDDYTSAEFAKKYYAVKIKIDAKTATE